MEEAGLAVRVGRDSRNEERNAGEEGGRVRVEPWGRMECWGRGQGIKAWGPLDKEVMTSMGEGGEGAKGGGGEGVRAGEGEFARVGLWTTCSGDVSKPLALACTSTWTS